MGALRQQPRGQLRIDRSNPITRGLAFFQSGGFDGPFANVNNSTVIPFGVGQGRNFVTGSNQYLLATDDKIQSGPMTLFALAQPSVVAGNKGIISIGASSNNRTALYIATGRIAIFSGAGSTTGQALGDYLASGTTYALAGRISSSSSRDVWVNGVLTGSNANTASPAAANRIAIGAVWANGAPVANQYFDGSMHLVLAWNRALSDDEMRSLAACPWQVFADLKEEDVDAPVAASEILSVTPAAVLLAGGQVSMRVSRRVAVQAAQLQLAGAEVGARASRKTSVQPAALVAAGGQVDLRAARRLAVSAAEITLQPGSAQLRAVRRLVVAPAAAALTGGSIEFVYTPVESGASYSISVAPAALALTGGNVTMRVTRKIAVAPAALALAGGDVRLLADRRLGVGAAVLQLGAGQALLRATRRLPIAAAQLVITGGTVTLHYSSQVEYTRAPAGNGYSPQRVEVQARPQQERGSRPLERQRTWR